MSRVFLIFASALVALMAGALFYAARIPVQAPQQVEAPEPLPIVTHPSFTLPDVDGKPFELSDWQGKHRILNFWATWCAPCRREIPLLKAFQDKHGRDGFQVIGIAVDMPEPVADYAAAAEFNYPVLVGEQDAMAVAESSGVEFIGLPFTMFVDHEGELLGAYMGELHQPQLDSIAEIMMRVEQADLSKAEARAALKAL